MTNLENSSKSASKINMQQQGFFQSFSQHPASVGQNYWSHAVFALKFGSRLFLASCACLVHAFIPALFETTASRHIKQMHSTLMHRHTNNLSD